MTTFALDTSGNTSGAPTAFGVLRYLDIVVLVLAAPLFVLLDLPLLGYAVGAAAWLVQRAINQLAQAKAERSDDPRTTVGLLAGSMIGRGWMVAGAILAVGLIGARADGLAAAVLSISLFTIYFAAQMVVRPFDEARRNPLPAREPRR